MIATAPCTRPSASRIRLALSMIGIARAVGVAHDRLAAPTAALQRLLQRLERLAEVAGELERVAADDLLAAQ